MEKNGHPRTSQGRAKKWTNLPNNHCRELDKKGARGETKGQRRGTEKEEGGRGGGRTKKPTRITKKNIRNTGKTQLRGTKNQPYLVPDVIGEKRKKKPKKKNAGTFVEQ